MKNTIDLNCDVGELAPLTGANFDKAIFPYLSSCNIACGFHSGDPALMEKTIRLALKHGVAIGAHPAYDDRENFGRTSVVVALPVLQAQIRYQVGALKVMTEALGGKLHHVKPHGALYNDMVKNDQLALAVIEAVQTIDPELIIFGLANSVVGAVCAAKKMKFVNEVFADRQYQGPVQLRSRQFEDAVLHDEQQVLAQVDLFLRGQVKDYDGQLHTITAESICLHSDTKGAVELAKSIHTFILAQDVAIHPIV